MQVDPIKPKLKPPGTKRLKLQCEKLLSTSAFKFNLRCYSGVDEKRHLCHQRGPHVNLMNEMLRQLTQTLPSLTIKTGSSDKCSTDQARRLGDANKNTNKHVTDLEMSSSSSSSSVAAAAASACPYEHSPSR